MLLEEYGDDDMLYEEDKCGLQVTPHSVLIRKDPSNMIGISIGGGAPFCPCLYVVQIFDGTPAAKDGSLRSGDELLAINDASVKGKTKEQVAKMIQNTEQEVKISYNKLHVNVTEGETLDIMLKKMKHRLVDKMSSDMADTLGLSRAILCNDSLIKRLKALQRTEQLYRGLVNHAKTMLRAHFDLLQTFKEFGDEFCQMSARESITRASEAFGMLGEFHRQLEKDGIKMIKSLKPVLADLTTYLQKAIPDTKLTVQKYADAKFAYLSYCLKIKEMDDEEHSYNQLREPLYRVETGNYEYRMVLRCRQEARSKFSKLRNDVMEKIELLEGKHAQDWREQQRTILRVFAEYHQSSLRHFEAVRHLFPIEIDLDMNAAAFQYALRETFDVNRYTDEPPPSPAGPVVQAEEAVEEGKGDLLPGLEAAAENGDERKREAERKDDPANALLVELGLADLDLNVGGGGGTMQDLDLIFGAFTSETPVEAKKEEKSENLLENQLDLTFVTPVSTSASLLD